MKTLLKRTVMLLGGCLLGLRLVAQGTPDDPALPNVTLTITAPAAGAQFAVGAEIPIKATAVDSTGAIMRLEFHADGKLIGVSEIHTLVPVPPGEPVHHEFIWREATAGTHTLTAVARGANEFPVISPAVTIQVGAVPTVSLELLNGDFTEGRSGEQDSGELLLRRTGPTDQALVVFLHYGGTATRFADYGPASTEVTLRAGASQARVSLYGIVDTLEEGDETVEVSIILPPTRPDVVVYHTEAGKDSATLKLHDYPLDRPPVVFAEAVKGRAMESSGDATVVDMLRYRINRGGNAGNDLRVFFHFAGQAKAGTDFAPLDGSAVIPAGQRTVEIAVVPLDDKLSEGTEAVILSLDPSPTMGPVEPYVIDASRQQAYGYIDDDEPWLSIQQPSDHWWYQQDEPVFIRALAVWSSSYISHLEFYADGQKIGDSNIDFLVPPPAGTEIIHEFTWNQVAAGTHQLTVRAALPDGTFVESLEPVTIVVGDPGALSVVTLELTDGTATEPSGFEFIDPLVVTVRRSGDVSRPLFVPVDTLGTADRRADYWIEPEDGEVYFAAGQTTAKVMIHPRADDLVEGSETVEIELGGPSCEDDGAGCYLVGQRAPVVGTIRDARGIELPVVTVHTQRQFALEGDHFNYGEIRIQRTGDLTKELTVFFELSGEARRGSDYRLVLDPCAACLRPEIEVTGSAVTIPAGQASVTLGILASFDGILTVAEPVLENVVLEVYTPPIPAVVGAQPPYLAGSPARAEVQVVDRSLPNEAEVILITPRHGAELPLGQANILEAIAVDPSGVIKRVEFTANDQLIGVSELTTEEVGIPGDLRLHRRAWTLSHAADAGNYALQALARNSQGTEIKSRPVLVKVVGAGTDLPTVTIAPGKHPAYETGDLKSRFGSFVVTRSGGRDDKPALTVFVQLKGSATLGLDYHWNPTVAVDAAGNMPGFGAFLPVMFAAGQAEATLSFEALPDDLLEGIETVSARLIDPPILAFGPAALLPFPPSYLIGEPREAAVEIMDANVTEPKVVLTKPANGAQFAAGSTIRLEATAVHPNFGIYGIQFLANNTVVGFVEYCCDVCDCAAPPVGVAFSGGFDWKYVPAGEYTLVARTITEANVIHQSEPVIIHVGEAKGATLVINAPAEGATFRLGETITIDTVGQDPEGLVSTVEFFVNGTKIGERCFLCVIDAIIQPGTPLHNQLDWTPSQPGDYRLTAIGHFGPDKKVESLPVTIHVTRGGAGGQLTIVQPENGAIVPVDQEVEVVAIGVGRFGGITDVVLLVDGQPAAESHIRFIRPPEADEEVQHQFKVRFAAGAHELKARDLFDPTVVSPPVHIVAGGTQPTIAWVRPADGDAFNVGQSIGLEVIATDPTGLIMHLDFYADDQKIGGSDFSCPVCLLVPGAGIRHKFEWLNAAVGSHILHASAVRADGSMVTSPKIQITVGEVVPPGSFVTRDLPGGYQPATKFIVRLEAKPAATVSAYAVEDNPPFALPTPGAPGFLHPYWQIGAISHNGVFDPQTGRVKFGPFLDHEPRTLTYEITPNLVVETAEFTGQGSADGVSSPIGGDRILRGAVRHPADNDPADNAIVVNEVTAYAAAWKTEHAWPQGPNPIPMDYVTRAAALWKGGEHYVFDPSAGAPPNCWVNGVAVSPGTDGTTTTAAHPFAGLAIRELKPGTNGSLEVTIRLLPAPGVQAFAAEEQLPADAVVSGISGDGVLTPNSMTIRWGPYSSGASQSVSYVLSSDFSAGVQGRASFDGQSVVIRPESADASTTGRLVSVDALADGTMQVSLEADALLQGAEYALEVSTDLKTWTRIGGFASESEAGFARDAGVAGDAPRFYRAVRLQ